ncbi:uncharacterized protein BP5553_03264 [Venustampulla echinocandica]|uniref:NIMA interactive protein n=1 Tax=Venustampulla echinocandica TaxID=2656787 RepID=A0A370TTU0_9HELO|nr:uncharacterized protein BP5553_03264 [Venustampulla echinocandica]RDL38924.1 hypothetical protein BP5553_03264 [Venustampulla echinocandica]
MEQDSLRTASLYINNQLLSRGLLRNGQTIDFACPETGEGGTEATTGRVISVINDLILRRDRDATQRENLSHTIRTLRADSLRQSTDLERVVAKYADSQRKLGLAEATERAFKQQIRSAEQSARASKEEMGRMRVLVSQTRRQCANELRKRERVIEGLKKHVADGRRPRGSGKAVGVISVNVVAGVGGDTEKTGDDVSIADTNYDLRMETNEFLTELARGLSEENENIGALLRRTVQTLRTLSGCEKGTAQEGSMVAEMETGYENLDTEMGFIIEHLRNLLTNPSFVPLEELEIREEEIIRLRGGFEKMESRWLEAVQMMDGWRKRMARGGQTVNLEELKMGLRLSPLKPKEGEPEPGFGLSTLLEEAECDTQAEIDALCDPGLPTPSEPEFEAENSDASESSLLEEDAMDQVSREDFAEPQHDITINTDSSFSPGPPPQLSPLRATSGNRGSKSSQQEYMDTTAEDETCDFVGPPLSPPKRNPRQAESCKDESSQLSSTPSDEISLLKTSNIHHRSPRKIFNQLSMPESIPKIQPTASSKLPRPRDNPLPQQSPLTMASIAAKLAATAREADAARVRAKIKAAKLNRVTPPSLEATKLMPSSSKPQTNDEDFEPGQKDTHTATVEGTKKRKANGRSQGGRACRRRSTLSPWELESLMLGGGGGRNS